jgi:cell division septal protein FtsQ
MAQAARRQPAHDEAPPVDPHAVDRAYRLERAKRRARMERQRASRRAGIRFAVTLLLLLALSIALVVLIWQQVQRLFGL